MFYLLLFMQNYLFEDLERDFSPFCRYQSGIIAGYFLTA